MKAQTRSSLFWVSIILLLVPALVYAYLLMPFPGSQNINAITLCYYLAKIVFPLRVLGAALTIFYLFKYFISQLFGGYKNQYPLHRIVLLQQAFQQV